MNERIRELARQSTGASTIYMLEEEWTKFAELIVQECCDLLETSLPYNPQQKMIKKHFGVE